MVVCRIEREVGTPTGQRDISKSSWNGLDAVGFKKHNPGSLNAKNSLACPICNRKHKTHEPCRNTKFRSVADLRRHVVRYAPATSPPPDVKTFLPRLHSH